MNVESGLQFDLLGMFRRRAGLIVAIGGLVLLLVYWVAMALPNEYQSFATIFVRPQSISDRLVESGAGQGDLTQRLNLMSAQILSRPRLSRLIDEMELYPEKSKEMLREDLIDYMRSRIEVEPVIPEIQQLRGRRDEPINTFKVFFTADSPAVAARVAQRLANDFIKEHIEDRVEMTQKSLEFMEAEQQRISQRALEVDAAISRIKRENPQRLPEDMLANQRLLERATSEQRAAHRALGAAKSDLVFWESQLLNSAVFEGGGEASSPTRRLQTLELSHGEMLARGYTEKHPDVLKVEQEIASLREKVSGQGEEEPSEILNPAQRAAASQRERAALEVEQATADVERLESQIDDLEARLVATPRVAEQLESLEREHAQLQESLADFDRRRLEAAVQVNLERRQLGEQFRVLETAFPSTDPSSPNRILLLIVGLFAGLALGGGAAIAVEGADSSFYAAPDLQSTLGAPVLAAIPEILLESDLRARRNRWLRRSAAGVAVTVFCLVGGAGSYLYVNGAPGWLAGADENEAVEDPGAVEQDAEEGDAAQRDWRIEAWS